MNLKYTRHTINILPLLQIMCPLVREYVCRSTQELLCLYDYAPSELPMKYKARRNGLPVAVQITPLDLSAMCLGDDYQLCQGISETVVTISDSSQVFIEQIGNEIIYRSRSCEKIAFGQLVQCQQCQYLLFPESKEVAKVENPSDMKDGDDVDFLDRDGLEDTFDVNEQKTDVPAVIEIKIPIKKKVKLKRMRKKISKDKKKKEERELSKCPFCEILIHQTRMAVHLVSEHIEDKGHPDFHKFFENEYNGSYFCPECGHSFKDNNSLSTHIRYYHKDKHDEHLSFKCELCGKGYMSEKGLEKHQENVHSSSDHECVCSECGKSFKNKTRLKMHHRSVHDRPTCKECGKAFPNKYLVKKHVKIYHLGIIENQCPTCGKGFVRPSLLHLHVQTVHLQIKPWVCEVCGFKTARQGNLNIHRHKSHSLPTITVKEFKSLVETGKHPHWNKDSMDMSLLEFTSH